MGRPREFDADIVLDAALDTFWKQGFEATSMEALCRTMEMAPASVYGAFGNKRALFVEALRRYMAHISVQALKLISGAPSGLDGIRAYFAHLVDAMVDGKRQWGCLITNSLVEFAMRDPELAGLFQVHLARLETTFAAALLRAQAEDELREGIGPESAGYLVALVQGLNVLAKSAPGRPALEAVVATTMRSLER